VRTADLDTDGDTIKDIDDNCPRLANPGQADRDTTAAATPATTAPTPPTPARKTPTATAQATPAGRRIGGRVTGSDVVERNCAVGLPLDAGRSKSGRVAGAREGNDPSGRMPLPKPPG